VTDWIHKIQTLGSQFREATLLNCNDGAREGILDIADRLHNVYFIQRLASGRIQTTVRSRNYQSFDETVETAPVEGSATASGQDRYRLEGTCTQRCGNCGKLGHASNSRGEARVNPVVSGRSEPPAKLLAFDAEKRAIWLEVVGNHRGDGKIMIPTRCRETS